MPTTDDPNDPRLSRGADEAPVPQADAYLVLPADELTPEKFVRPVRRSYRHRECGQVTTMSVDLAQTYARNPRFYGATYCVSCQMHRPVGEFVWVEEDGSETQTVGS